MLLVDVNVLMYAAGGEHPHRAASVAFLEQVARGEVEAVLDTEILQEVLQRYRALRRWEEGRRLYDRARAIFPIVLPITVAELDRARQLLDAHPTLMARDALHVAVVEIHGLEALCSFDRDFDQIPTIRRLEPS